MKRVNKYNLPMNGLVEALAQAAEVARAAEAEALRRGADPDAVRELELYADNDGRTYEAATLPTVRNLERKRARGIFDAAKAVKAFEHVAEAAARRYVAEFGGRWCAVFSAQTRRAVAARMLAGWLADAAWSM